MAKSGFGPENPQRSETLRDEFWRKMSAEKPKEEREKMSKISKILPLWSLLVGGLIADLHFINIGRFLSEN